MSGPPQRPQWDGQTSSRNSPEKKQLGRPRDRSGQEPQSDHPADSDLRAWLQAFGCLLVFFNTWGLVLSFGAIQSFYQLVLLPHHSASAIAWIGSLQAFLLVFSGLFIGPVYDMGYARALLVVGSLLTVFGMLMLSLCTQYWEIMLAQGVCVGLGSGMVYSPSLSIVAAAFTSKRPLAVAIGNSGISIGGISYLLAFQHLIGPLGFAWTIRTMGFISLGAFAAGVPMLLLGKVATKGKRRAVVDTKAWKDVPFLILCVGGFFRFLGYFTPIFFLPLFGETVLGLSQKRAIDLALIFSGVSFFGRILGSLVAQRTKIMLPWLTYSIVVGVLCLVWPAVHNFGGGVVFAALYGFFSGPLTVLPPVVLPYFCPNLTVIGTRMGMLWAISSFAFLVGSPIGAAIAHPTDGHFLGLQLFSGFSLIFGAAMLSPIWNLIQKKQTE